MLWWAVLDTGNREVSKTISRAGIMTGTGAMTLEVPSMYVVDAGEAGLRQKSSLSSRSLWFRQGQGWDGLGVRNTG